MTDQQVSQKAQDLTAVIRSLRLCFNRLKLLGDDLHRDLGITASMRAVMESLAERGDQTVPQIARAKDVSRQHIQVIVDALINAGLVDLRTNPAHKRSALVVLTGAGRKAFAKIRSREASVLAELGAGLPSQDLRITRATLDALNGHLNDRRKEILEDE